MYGAPLATLPKIREATRGLGAPPSLFSRILGRCLRGRWGSIDSAELMIVNAIVLVRGSAQRRFPLIHQKGLGVSQCRTWR